MLSVLDGGPIVEDNPCWVLNASTPESAESLAKMLHKIGYTDLAVVMNELGKIMLAEALECDRNEDKLGSMNLMGGCKYLHNVAKSMERAGMIELARSSAKIEE